MRRATHLSIIGLVLVLAVGMASVGAAAGDTAETTQISSIYVTIADEEFAIENVEISGESLPSYEIDERTYELDSAAVQSDGVTVKLGDTTYEICNVDLHLENSPVTIADVSIDN